MNYTDKVIRQSNFHYNDGLRRAQMRDLSGAITSLKKSLQFCQKNIAARNLLGLVYYGRGEINEALVEWIISKNLKPKDNVANHFIKKIQASSNHLERMNNSIKRYNQSLIACQQDAEDMAIMQLRKVIADHPTFVKAYQLAALLYIRKEQFSKARQLLIRAKKLDITNPDTLYYLNELPRPKRQKKVQDSGESVSYQVGNDTIIQPTAPVVKETVGTSSMVNIAIGIIIGASVIGLLIVPTIQESGNRTNANAIREYSQEIDAQRAQINALTTELDTYRVESENLEELMEKSDNLIGNFELLIEIEELFEAGKILDKSILELISQIEVTTLGEKAEEKFIAIKEEVYQSQLENRYPTALAKFNVKDSNNALTELEIIVEIDESYKEYEAMLMLAITYKDLEQFDNAIKYFEIISKNCTKEEILESAKEELNEITLEPVESVDEIEITQELEEN